MLTNLLLIKTITLMSCMMFLVTLHIFILITLRNHTNLRVVQPQQCQVIVLVWQYIVKANPFYYQNLHNIEKAIVEL